MIAAVDVQYATTVAAAALVAFADWPNATGAHELTKLVPDPAPYVPGQFFERELPCILSLLEGLTFSVEVLVIDGYVTLDPSGRPGLGAYLHQELKGAIPVIGVAKSAFQGSPHAIPVRRGGSERPLYVTSRGLPAEVAASYIQAMHGLYRVPTLLKRTDRLCREKLLELSPQ